MFCFRHLYLRHLCLRHMLQDLPVDNLRRARHRFSEALPGICPLLSANAAFLKVSWSLPSQVGSASCHTVSCHGTLARFWVSGPTVGRGHLCFWHICFSSRIHLTKGNIIPNPPNLHTSTQSLHQKESSLFPRQRGKRGCSVLVRTDSTAKSTAQISDRLMQPTTSSGNVIWTCGRQPVVHGSLVVHEVGEVDDRWFGLLFAGEIMSPHWMLP